MAQYIDKSVIVAEIEKRKKRNVLNEGAFEEDIDILSFLDTLEVKKEVTTTDAFVKKAYDWLKDCLDNGMWIANDAGCAEKDVIIEDFINYMEGE